MFSLCFWVGWLVGVKLNDLELGAVEPPRTHDKNITILIDKFAVLDGDVRPFLPVWKADPFFFTHSGVGFVYIHFIIGWLYVEIRRLDLRSDPRCRVAPTLQMVPTCCLG